MPLYMSREYFIDSQKEQAVRLLELEPNLLTPQERRAGKKLVVGEARREAQKVLRKRRRDEAKIAESEKRR